MAALGQSAQQVPPMRISPEAYPQTIMLRNNSRMIRDCWAETDESGEIIFCIRQIRFNDDGSAGESTIVRIVGSEIHAIVRVLASIK